MTNSLRKSPRDRNLAKLEIPVFVKFQASLPHRGSNYAELTRPAVRLLGEIFGELPGFVYHSGTLSREERIEMLRFESKSRSRSGWYEIPAGTLVDSAVWRHMAGEREGYLSFWRDSAKRELRAEAWRFGWRTSTSGDDTLECEVSILDARRDQFPAIEKLFDVLMEAAACGHAHHASAEPYVAARFWKGNQFSTTMTRVGDARAQLEASAWSSMEEKDGFVPCCTWYNLLSPAHLRKFGGFDAFSSELKGDERNAQCELRQRSNGYATLNVWPELVRSLRRDDSLPMDLWHEELAWPQWRFAKAGMLMWQSPKLMDRTAPPVADSKVDEPAGEIGESTDAEFAAFVKRMWANPPACVQPNSLPVKGAERKAIENSYGRAATGFSITRSDRPEAHSLWLRRRTRGGQIVHVDPVYVGGSTRQSAAFVFDGSKHGFDGEFGNAPARPKKAAEPYHCPRCGHGKFFCTAIFQYAGENNEELENPAFIARVQDFFSWFALRARCASCKHSMVVIDVECA